MHQTKKFVYPSTNLFKLEARRCVVHPIPPHSLTSTYFFALNVQNTHTGHIGGNGPSNADDRNIKNKIKYCKWKRKLARSQNCIIVVSHYHFFGLSEFLLLFHRNYLLWVCKSNSTDWLGLRPPLLHKTFRAATIQIVDRTHTKTENKPSARRRPTKNVIHRAPAEQREQVIEVNIRSEGPFECNRFGCGLFKVSSFGFLPAFLKVMVRRAHHCS